MTLKEIAEITGAAHSTVAAYAQKAGWTENGKQTLLDERQVTIILEAMKQATINQSDLPSRLEGIETSHSRVLRLQILQKQMQDIYEAEIADLKAVISEVKPIYDLCVDSDSLMSISTMAKKLNRPGFGPKSIFNFLNEKRVVYRNSAGYWVPYQEHINLGRFVVKQVPRSQGGAVIIHDCTRVTQKGYAYVERLISEAFSLEATA